MRVRDDRAPGDIPEQTAALLPVLARQLEEQLRRLEQAPRRRRGPSLAEMRPRVALLSAICAGLIALYEMAPQTFDFGASGPQSEAQMHKSVRRRIARLMARLQREVDAGKPQGADEG